MLPASRRFPKPKAILQPPVSAILLILLFSSCTGAIPLMATTTDKTMVDQVYGDLKRVIGDKRRDWPTIIIMGAPNRVAAYVAEENTIYIDQKAIEVCKKFEVAKKDALAFIIGHELTHFYQKHEWSVSGFASYFMVSVEDFRENREHERQADIYGGFIAQQAGYSTIALVPALLEAIYDAYQLSKERNAVYPSLAERKKLAAESCAIAGDLINAYQMANYLMIIGAFEEAFTLYNYLIKTIRFKELHNNLGLASLSILLKSDNTPLQYPLEINTNIPIERSEVYQSRKFMAQTAEEHLLTAYNWDAGYLDAGIHLITALDWNNKPQEARKLLGELEQQPIPPAQSAQLFLTAGNLFARLNQPAVAQAYYKKIRNLNANDYFANMAEHNLAVLNNRASAEKKFSFFPVQNLIQPIDKIELSKVKSFSRDIQINDRCRFLTTEQSNSTITYLLFNDKRIKLQFIRSPKVNINGIGIGSPQYLLEEKFPGKSFKKIAFSDGFFFFSISKGLLFKVNARGSVEEWGVLLL